MQTQLYICPDADGLCIRPAAPKPHMTTAHDALLAPSDANVAVQHILLVLLAINSQRKSVHKRFWPIERRRLKT